MGREPGEILTHTEMCQEEGMMLQRGMVFRSPPHRGVILMSQRPNAPYIDEVSAEGNIIYEGHDAPRTADVPEPKQVDQPRYTARLRPTENGKFADWTDRAKRHEVPPARFNIYEKLRDGIWVFRGPFLLRDYEYKQVGPRKVFRFTMHPIGQDDSVEPQDVSGHELQSRLIPTWVKQAVYKRDNGRCVMCGSEDQLHFDHDLPYSKGGASATPENVQLLCARHNLSKGAKIY